MTSRRAALSVPGSEPAKIAKALAIAVDEVVVDLEDAVSPQRKPEARDHVKDLARREYGSLAVRVNGATTPWHAKDLRAAVENNAVTTIVVPKVESAHQLEVLDEQLTSLERAHGRSTPLRVQVLIESARGLSYVQEIALATSRVDSLILGYADLAASLGRRPESSWQFARDRVVLAARTADVQAIDGPLLTVHDDTHLRDAATEAEALGFDGKWVIHPRQVQTVIAAFTPSPERVAEAREILMAMEEAARRGQGAVAWRGRMLDEALVVQAQRLLARVGPL